MKKYKVRYEIKKGYGFARETIEARGLKHAFKLAQDHLKEIKKTSKIHDLRIAQIYEVDSDVED